MTKDKIDALLTRLDRLGLGADDGSVISVRNDAALVSANSAPFVLLCIHFSLVPWKGLKSSSRIYLIEPRMPRLSLNF